MSAHDLDSSWNCQQLSLRNQFNEDSKNLVGDFDGSTRIESTLDTNNQLLKVEPHDTSSVITEPNQLKNSLAESSNNLQSHIISPSRVINEHCAVDHSFNQVSTPTIKTESLYESLPKMNLNEESDIKSSSIMTSVMTKPIISVSESQVSENKKPKKSEKRFNHVYTKIQKENLRDLFKEHGPTWKMIKYSNETGIKEDYCRRLINSLKKGDDITNKKKRGPPAKHSIELLKEIIQEVKIKGKSTREASKLLKVSPSSICRYMKKEEAKEILDKTLFENQHSLIVNQENIQNGHTSMELVEGGEKTDNKILDHFNSHTTNGLNLKDNNISVVEITQQNITNQQSKLNSYDHVDQTISKQNNSEALGQNKQYYQVPECKSAARSNSIEEQPQQKESHINEPTEIEEEEVES
ncbi:hypothetical protein QTN25_007101 [Entamoeba marina]